MAPASRNPFANKPSGRPTPHVRLNSGNDNILDNSPMSRSLTGGRRQRLSIRTQNLYGQRRLSASSTERLLPPTKHQYRDVESPYQSPTSESSSKRSSWASENADWSPRSPAGPFATTFDDSDDFNTQTVAAKYNVTPSNGLLLFPEDVEKDDWLHNPDPNEKDRVSCNIFNKRGITNCGALFLMTAGLLFLFIGYPAMSFIQQVLRDSDALKCSNDPMCISIGKFPLLKNSRVSLIDPDTPQSAMTRKGVDGRNLKLVFSDEFNRDGRTFYDGDDPYWQGVDIWYGATEDLEWYDPDALWTQGGALNIKFDAFQNHNLNYRSGMLQSWNKLCFKGGRLEASISLPGRGDTSGFWPGFWSMGNLGRPGYLATTDGMWPYSYDNLCDAGITPNQSDPSGLNYLPGMRLPACSCTGEDHPTPGLSRSAPEIDAIEGSTMYLDPPAGAAIGSASQSLQTAPFDVFWRPDYNFLELYDPTVTEMNSYMGGQYQQAISGVTTLNNKWYEAGGQQYQSYSFDYIPGAQGKVGWWVGEEPTWLVDARSMGPNGNIGQRTVSQEPMSIIANFGMSNSFAQINMTGLATLMPATMRFDYIRIYQPDDEVLITCDPPGYPTTGYIAQHPEPYNNPNITHWSNTGYKWPKNALMNDCKAANFKGSIGI